MSMIMRIFVNKTNLRNKSIMLVSTYNITCNCNVLICRSIKRNLVSLHPYQFADRFKRAPSHMYCLTLIVATEPFDLLKAGNSIIMSMSWRGTAADSPEQIEGGRGFHITRNPRALAIIWKDLRQIKKKKNNISGRLCTQEVCHNRTTHKINNTFCTSQLVLPAAPQLVSPTMRPWGNFLKLFLKKIT